LKIVMIKEKDAEKHSEITMKKIFDESVLEGTRTTFGTVSIPPRIRVPLEGTGAHDADEYSIVLKGSLLTISGGQEHRISAGEATFIPKGEEHWAYNDGKENCEIVWVLVKR
jgi:quercetin dioxygenase-like cupin family protein